jgi:hypothetical protein
MTPAIRKSLFLLLLIGIAHLLIPCRLIAQEPISAVLTKINAHSQQLQLESCYLSFDKPSYFAGDTMRFKAFVMTGTLEMSLLSEKLHIELFNDSARLVDQMVISIANGLGYGNMTLFPNIKEGRYTVRAYTNWQKNLGSEYFFQKTFDIGTATNNSWLLRSQQTISGSQSDRKLKIDMQFLDLEGQPQGYKDLMVNLIEGNKKLGQTKLQTSLDGKITAQIPLPMQQSKSGYFVQFTELPSKMKVALVPVTAIDSSDIDVQFMPEGGKMVNGITGRIGFKAIGSNGSGVDIEGKIIDQKGSEVSSFKSGHKGMGSFRHLPVKDNSYSLAFSYKGLEFKRPIPGGIDEGTTIKIDQFSNKDSVMISLRASANMAIAPSYELFILTGEKVALAMKIGLQQRFLNLKLPKNVFPKGLLHFALISSEGEVMNERQAIITVNDIIKINVKKLSPKNSSDSVKLEVMTSNDQNTPVSTTLSLGITNNDLVRTPDQSQNILSYYFLEKNLKGFVEAPGWYFTEGDDREKAKAVDDLLLTQGWIGYSWEKVLDTKKVDLTFKAEILNAIDGSITGLFNKPKNNIKLTLLSLGKDVFVMDTITNDLGRFSFKNVPVIDSPEFAIKIKTLKDRSSTAKVNIDSFTPTIEKLKAYPFIQQPWFVNPDSLTKIQGTTARIRNSQLEKYKLSTEGNFLKEVEIKAIRSEIITNVAWDANLVKELDSTELQKMPSKTLMILLKELAPGFTVGRYWASECGGKPSRHTEDSYMIGNQLISSVRLDKINTAVGVGEGLSVKNGMALASQAIFDLNTVIFNALTTKEITNIAIYKGCAFNYIEITTRSGKGPWFGKTTGMSVYRPMPLHLGSPEYKPKYLPALSSVDTRSTMYWNATITTGEDGKAIVTFYPGGANKNYTLKLEGTDLNGRFGFKSLKNRELPFN